VRDLVERRVAKAAADDDIETIRRMMRDAWSDTLAVVGSDGTFRGVLTFQDLEGRAGPVGRLNVRSFPTTLEAQSLHEAMATMLVEGVAWLPVLDDRGGLVGAVTMSAFARLTAAPA